VTTRAQGRDFVTTAAAVAALAACHFAWIRPTNFLGFDEWMIVWLTDRGIVSQPQAGRPIVLAWSMPAALLAPHRLYGYHVLLGAYLALSGVLVFALCRAVGPRLRVVAPLAGVLAAIWAPLDYQRLATVHMTLYGGLTFGTLLTLVLFLGSVRRSSLLLLAAAAGVALFTAFSYEATLPLLFVPPLAAAMAWPGFRRRTTWAAAWAAVVALGTLPAAAAYLRPRSAAYQEAYGLDLNAFRIAGRLLQHHAFDLWPVLSTPISEVAVLPAAICAAALIVMIVATRSEAPPAPGPPERLPLALAAAAGLGLAALGHLMFIASPGLTTPNRTQFLCAPGTAIFLAAAVALLASVLRERWRLAAVAAMGAWIVGVSAGRTAAHQRIWDTRTAYPAQVHLLSRLVALAPDVKPNTLFVLLDGRGEWPDTYGFDHAVRYLYEGRARGHVWGARSFLYNTTFGADRIRREPREDIRAAWDDIPSVHGYDETIAVRHAADGSVSVLDRFPARVAAVPAAQAYDPSSRLVSSRREPPARRILR
jgi:hypothetical protein